MFVFVYACVCIINGTCSLPTGVMRSVLWAVMVRTVKVCVTAPMAHAAITFMEAVCVSQVSAARSALGGCVLRGLTACTANTDVSATPNTLSGGGFLVTAY